MSVYVDDQLLAASVRNGTRTVRGLWSHLMADDTTELLTLSTKIELDPAWLQKPATPLEHFAITAGKRLRAISCGAIPISHAEGGHLIRAKRAGVSFDLDLLRTAPAVFDAQLHAATEHLHRPPPSRGPHRVRLSRAPGFQLPPNTISVVAPTRWANPYRPAARTSAASQAAVAHFRDYLTRNPVLVDHARAELPGLNLACWCSPHLACHADVWLAVANPGPPGDDPAVRRG